MADVMAEFYDGAHATPPPADDGPVYLGIKNITDAGALDLSDVRHISEADFPRWTRRVTPRAGDVVFTYEATLHRYALIPERFRGCLGRRLALIRPDPSVALSRFLHFAMLGPEWKATVTERIISGSTVDRIPLITFGQFPIRLPDLATQAIVVQVLAALDDLIENNRRRIELLEQLAEAIYREWFVRFRYPGRGAANFVDSPVGDIPEGWSVRPLSELAGIDKGLSYKGVHLSDDGTPMANLKCFIPVGGYRRDGTKRYSGPFKPKHQVVPGDLLLANTDLTQAGAVIGSPALVPRRGFESGGIITHHVFAVRCAREDTLWLYHALRDSRFRTYARSVASGTTVLGLRPDDVLSYPVVCPPKEIRAAFARMAAHVVLTGETLLDEAEQLALIRGLVLPRLVSGRIDVSHLALDKLAGSVA